MSHYDEGPKKSEKANKQLGGKIQSKLTEITDKMDNLKGVMDKAKEMNEKELKEEDGEEGDSEESSKIDPNPIDFSGWTEDEIGQWMLETRKKLENSEYVVCNKLGGYEDDGQKPSDKDKK